MPYCRFCFDNKIEGPHNHYLRESKDPSAQITCPLLLNTQCMKCNKKGHTTKYCRVKQSPSEVKMAKYYDDNGFMIIQGKNKKSTKYEKVFIENKNNFTILCENSDDDDDGGEKVLKNEVNNIMFSKRPYGMSWADWDEIDE